MSVQSNETENNDLQSGKRKKVFRRCHSGNAFISRREGYKVTRRALPLPRGSLNKNFRGVSCGVLMERTRQASQKAKNFLRWHYGKNQRKRHYPRDS